MKSVYATSYQTENYCGAYRHGVLVLIRLRDQASCLLDLADTNKFKHDVFDYELSTDDRNLVDRACNAMAIWFRKRKWIYAAYGGSIIHVHNEPVGEKA